MRKSSANWVILLAGALMLPIATAQEAACIDGEADGVARTFACSHVNLIEHLSLAEMGMPVGEVANDVWGWTDPLDGLNYVLLGTYSGTVFVRIEATGVLTNLGYLPDSDGEATVDKVEAPREKSCHDEVCGGSDSSWRDIKVYGNHAYIVSEGLGHGVQVFDLTRLRGVAAPQVWARDGYYGTDIGSAHNIFINEDSGRAYVVGGREYGGSPVILDIETDPLNPAKIGVMLGDGYTHDIQCVVYSGPDPDIAAGSEICFASNADTVTTWNATNPASPVVLSRFSYAETGYTHQGWLDAEQKYFYFNDELDELDYGTRTHTRILNVSDLSAPTFASEYYAPTLAIDHNNYVHGDFLYQANYTAGLRILDISDRTHPVQAAFFDTQASDAPVFQGTWSNYRFPNGLVALSDINDGLFVVEPTLDDTLPVNLVVTPVEPDGTITEDELTEFSFVVSNNSANEATDVLFTASFPTGVQWTSVDAAGGICTNQARVIDCRFASIPADGEVTIAVSYTPDSIDSHYIFAMAYANETDSSSKDNLVPIYVRPAGKYAPPNKIGGGGSFDPYFLLLVSLLGVGLLRRRLIRG